MVKNINGDLVNPECLTYQWQIAYFDGLDQGQGGGFPYNLYYFKPWKNILPGTVLTYLNNTTTDKAYNQVTNGVITDWGHFQLTFGGYQSRTLEWRFLTGTANEYFSRKYPHLLRLKVSNGCTEATSAPIDPDPINTSPGNGSLGFFNNDINSFNSVPIIYPNPSTNSKGFTIELAGKDFTYELYDINGKKLQEGNANSIMKITNNNLAPGIYLIKVNYQGVVTTRKLQILE